MASKDRTIGELAQALYNNTAKEAQDFVACVTTAQLLLDNPDLKIEYVGKRSTDKDEPVVDDPNNHDMAVHYLTTALQVEFAFHVAKRQNYQWWQDAAKRIMDKDYLNIGYEPGPVSH